MTNRNTFKGDAKNPHAMGYFNLLKTASWIELQVKEALKPYDLTHSQLNVLSILARNHPNPMTSEAIKESLVVASPDVTRLLDRLVKKGFINRKTCPTNRRKLDIAVTKNGIDFFYKVHCVAKQAVSNYFEDNITQEEARILFKILGKMRS